MKTDSTETKVVPCADSSPSPCSASYSGTPRTDKLAGEWIACETVPASHARELERELGRVVEQRQKLRDENWRMRVAAQAVVDRWECPVWKETEPTADVIYRLRDVLLPNSDSATKKT